MMAWWWYQVTKVKKENTVLGNQVQKENKCHIGPF